MGSQHILDAGGKIKASGFEDPASSGDILRPLLPRLGAPWAPPLASLEASYSPAAGPSLAGRAPLLGTVAHLGGPHSGA